VSWPLRRTSRETQTTTGRSVRPSRARTSPPPEPGWKVFSSTPGGSCAIRAAASGVRAEAMRERVYSPRWVIVSVESPIRRSSCRAAGSCAQPASWPCVVATSRSAPAARRAGAIRPSGAAAPNHTEVQPCSRSRPTARRVAPGVGSSMVVRSRTTVKGCSASKARVASIPSRVRFQVEA
jgi:hypothetical protein